MARKSKRRTKLQLKMMAAKRAKKAASTRRKKQIAALLIDQERHIHRSIRETLQFHVYHGTLWVECLDAGLAVTVHPQMFFSGQTTEGQREEMATYFENLAKSIRSGVSRVGI